MRTEHEFYVHFTDEIEEHPNRKQIMLQCFNALNSLVYPINLCTELQYIDIASAEPIKSHTVQIVDSEL